MSLGPWQQFVDKGLRCSLLDWTRYRPLARSQSIPNRHFVIEHVGQYWTLYISLIEDASRSLTSFSPELLKLHPFRKFHGFKLHIGRLLWQDLAFWSCKDRLPADQIFFLGPCTCFDIFWHLCHVFHCIFKDLIQARKIVSSTTKSSQQHFVGQALRWKTT